MFVMMLLRLFDEMDATLEQSVGLNTPSRCGRG